MSKGGILKEYPINCYYFAEVYDDSIHKKYSTLLLKRGEEYIDLCHPYRKIVLEKNSEDKSYRVAWKYLLVECFFTYLFHQISSMNVIRAFLLFLKYKSYLEEQSVYLRSSGILPENPKVEENLSISSRV